MRPTCFKRFLALAFLLVVAAGADETRQANGVKAGEVSDTSAIVWMRLTANSRRNHEGEVRRGQPVDRPVADVSALEGAVPGAAGQVRLRYGTREDLRGARVTAWAPVSAERNYTHQFRLSGLRPGTRYFFSTETAGPGGATAQGALRGSFQTAPPPRSAADVRFTVMTCQAYRSLDDPEGFLTYSSMLKLDPDFHVSAGDLVYYDSDDPRATTPALARYHWERIYSLPRLIAFHLRVPTYFEKDDHDTLADDVWPGGERPQMAPMTFAEGQRIFREQAPMGEKTYRTFRWGRRLQVWLTEGRDFRSPNRMPDGPEKSIWGREQKRWLLESLQASDAEWKVLVSPTPIVGPDRKNKADNHSNAAFAFEGNEFRQWVRRNLPGNFFVVCGDRHWQYHSVHPETGLHEFATGPASDVHAGGTPGEDPRYHRFHRVKGGFLSVTVNGAGITFRHHDVSGNVVYEYSRPRGSDVSRTK